MPTRSVGRRQQQVGEGLNRLPSDVGSVIIAGPLQKSHEVTKSAAHHRIRESLGPATVILYLAVCCLSPATVASDELQCVPDHRSTAGTSRFEIRDHARVPAGAIINRIAITGLDVFDEDDPRESNAFYRLANRWHINTLSTRIAQQLLIGAGDPYDQDLIEESARLLRHENYLYDADIRPVSVCNGKVDLEVVTRDVWSLSPEVSFSRTGAESEFKVGIWETNFLGHGTELALRSKRELERDSTEFIYKDTNVRGSRLRSQVEFSNSDDGSERLLSLMLPFYALDAKRSWTVSVHELEQVQTQYFRGEEISEVEVNSQDYYARYGWSGGSNQGLVQRWQLGIRYSNTEFSPGPLRPSPGVFPTDKRLVYPFLEYSRLHGIYARATNLDQIHRTEDLHLGPSVSMHFGVAADAFGSDRDRLVASGSYSDTLRFDGNMLWTHELSWSGLYNLADNAAEDVVVRYMTRYFRHQTSHRSFFARLSASYTHNLNSNQQV